MSSAAQKSCGMKWRINYCVCQHVDHKGCTTVRLKAQIETKKGYQMRKQRQFFGKRLAVHGSGK